MEFSSMIKKIFSALCFATMLFVLFSFTASAEEYTIGSCENTNPGEICNVLKGIYGEDSTVIYSTTQTSSCKYSSSINVNGVQTTVYLSEKPKVGVDTSHLSDKLVVDMVEIESKWTNEKLLEYVKQYCFVPVTTRGNSPYNEIAIKLGEVFGEDSNIRFCVAQAIDSAKTIINEKGNNVDAQGFLDENFYKVKMDVNGDKMDVYLSETPTNNQLKALQGNSSLPMLPIIIIFAIVAIISMIAGFILVKKRRLR